MPTMSELLANAKCIDDKIAGFEPKVEPEVEPKVEPETTAERKPSAKPKSKQAK